MTTDWSRPAPPESVSLDLYAAVLLGIAALLTAWSAYKSDMAGGNANQSYTTSTQLLSDANFFFSQGNSDLGLDHQLFVEYMIARTDGNEKGAAQLRSLMTPNLTDAIDYWDANGRTSTPFDLDDEANPYEVESWNEGADLQTEYEETYAAGQKSDKISDRYQRAAVLFALALFFGGIGSLLKRPTVGLAALVMGVVGVASGIAVMLS